jgi:hypothetical protein
LFRLGLVSSQKAGKVPVLGRLGSSLAASVELARDPVPMDGAPGKREPRRRVEQRWPEQDGLWATLRGRRSVLACHRMSSQELPRAVPGIALHAARRQGESPGGWNERRSTKMLESTARAAHGLIKKGQG